MIDSIKRMSLDLHSTTSNESVRVKRRDTGRKICISLVDGGLPYTISDGCYAYFTAKKPDGNILKNLCSIENNTIIYRLTEQTTSVVGRVDSEIKLYGADGRCITSSKFTIYVYDTVYSTGDDTQPDKTDPVLQSKTVKPEADPVIVRPDTGYDALFQVVVEGDSDLVPENIKKGVNIFGVGGSYEGSGGITLPTLDPPGTADDLASGKQFIDAAGNVVTGTVPVKDIVAQTQFNSAFFDSQNGKISVVSNLGEKAIVSGTASIFTNVPANNFGDATAGDVVKGKTFTSKDGLKVVGTMAPGSGGGFTVTDDGAGNVTITSSAITDNNGNVVIA